MSVMSLLNLAQLSCTSIEFAKDGAHELPCCCARCSARAPAAFAVRAHMATIYLVMQKPTCELPKLKVRPLMQENSHIQGGHASPAGGPNEP